MTCLIAEVLLPFGEASGNSALRCGFLPFAVTKVSKQMKSCNLFDLRCMKPRPECTDCSYWYKCAQFSYILFVILALLSQKRIIFALEKLINISIGHAA